MNHECQHLDDYLANDLPSEVAAQFAEHLPGCDECREAVEEQLWIDGLLQSPERLQLEAVPLVLVEMGQNSPVKRRLGGRSIAAIVLAAAAAIFIAIGVQLNRQADENATSKINGAQVAVEGSVRDADAPKATFVASDNSIVVPMKSQHPNVTVVRVYSTFRPRYETQTASIEPEAAAFENESTFSNGG